MKISFNSLNKIHLIKNQKKPVFKSWNKKNVTTIDNSTYNVGILTGNSNNLLCLDIDIKDAGLIEFNKYIEKYGEPQTVKQKTINGGFHYIFKNTHSDEKYNYLIQNYLTTKTKYRGVGIDIRNEGGYFCCEPSIIDNKKYEFIRSFDKYDILEMPTTLIDWLLINNDTSEHIKNIKAIKGLRNNCQDMVYDITDDELLNLLDKLPQKYLNKFSEWLYILTIFKNMNKWDIFNKWSSTSTHYDEDNNIKLWNSNKGELDVNYLIFILNIENKLNLSLVSAHKKYTPITKINDGITLLNMNNKYLYDENYDEKQFTKGAYDKYSTIILKSTTGTGKTTSVASHFKNETTKNIISIIPRISLATQHIDTFKKQDIELLSYIVDDNKKELVINNCNIVICVNSLLKLNRLTIDEIKNSIIFIDEIASFLESLTDNDTLNKNLKQINILLMKLIKNAYKVIVSDAIINDGVFELLKYRDDNNKIFITNEYIKYKNVEAVKINDEVKFLDMVKQKINIGDPFFFPCDSCSTVTKFYVECLNNAPEKYKDKFILITADTKIKINNASEELKDKFVFYSPSITYGVDFQSGEKQDVFNYIKGNSIQPNGFFQQTTRTRNINKLYYFCTEKENKAEYNSLDEVKQYYKDVINVTNNNLNNICVSIDENDELKINENTFFNLFCYNEYIKDIYNTNKLKHFETLLISNGFKLSKLCKERFLTKERNKELNENKDNFFNDIFEEYLTASPENKQDNKFISINDHVTSFKLQDRTDEQLNIIKECILDKHYFKDILTYNRLIMTDDDIKQKIKQSKIDNYDVKTFNSSYLKIKVLKDILNKFDMKLFNFEFETDTYNIPDELLKLYKIVFNKKEVKQVKTKDELIKFIVDNYKLLIPSLNLIDTEKKRVKSDKRTYIYKFSEKQINKVNKILEIYDFKYKRVSSDRDFIENINTNDGDVENEYDTITSLLDNGIKHEYKINDKIYKYERKNNICCCSHCNLVNIDIYSHIMECKEFKLF